MSNVVDFEKFLKDAIKKKYTGRLIFTGPEGGVVRVVLVKGKIKDVDSTWDYTPKELERLKVWKKGSVIARSLSEAELKKYENAPDIVQIKENPLPRIILLSSIVSIVLAASFFTFLNLNKKPKTNLSNQETKVIVKKETVLVKIPDTNQKKETQRKETTILQLSKEREKKAYKDTNISEVKTNLPNVQDKEKKNNVFQCNTDFVKSYNFKLDGFEITDLKPDLDYSKYVKTFSVGPFFLDENDTITGKLTLEEDLFKNSNAMIYITNADGLMSISMGSIFLNPLNNSRSDFEKFLSLFKSGNGINGYKIFISGYGNFSFTPAKSDNYFVVVLNSPEFKKVEVISGSQNYKITAKAYKMSGRLEIEIKRCQLLSSS